MARISINITSDLMARLDPIKHQINVSELCREAIERRVSAFEGAAGNNGGELDIDGLVTRLREEAVKDAGKIERLGQESAASWLTTTSYDEFLSVAEAQNISNMQKYKLPRVAFKTMKRDMDQAKSNCEGAQAKEYKTAWLDFVRMVWTQVAPKLNPEGALVSNNGNGDISPDAVEEPAERPASGRTRGDRVAAQQTTADGNEDAGPASDSVASE